MSTALKLTSPPQTAVRRQLPGLLGSRFWPVAAMGAGSVLVGLTESSILAVLAQVAAALVAGSSRVRVAIGPVRIDQSISTLLAIAAGLALARLALQGVVAVLPARIAADFLAALRRGLLAAFTRASWAAQSTDREGELQELMTTQTAQASVASLQASMMATSILTFTVMAASAVVLSPLAALAVLLTAGVLFALLRPLAAFGSRRAQDLSRTSIAYAGAISETGRLAEESHVFGVSDAQNRRGAELVSTVRRQYFQMQLAGNLVPGIYQSLMYLVVITGLAILYIAGAGHVATLGAVVLMLVRAGSYGQQAQTTYQNTRQALPYLERVQAAQQRYIADAAADGTESLESIQRIALELVGFRYQPATPVLHELSFAVMAGETVGIIGPSGAGKSTLVQILLALRKPTIGAYLINGRPASSYKRCDWHRAVAYVPQEPQLLHASVSDNISFLRGLPPDAIERAAMLAGIHDEIVTWPQGYATIIGPRADAVSGGQRQRICLARALAASPELLVLDEPTSALDRRSELVIQRSLTELKGKVTMFIVAHRLSLLEVCDRVMVIRAGRMEAFEDTAQLRATDGYYRRMIVATPATAGGAGETSSA